MASLRNNKIFRISSEVRKEMVSWVESRIVSDPKWPQCLITFAPSVFPAQLSKRNFRYWLRDPASQGTLQSFPPELGCPGLA